MHVIYTKKTYHVLCTAKKHTLVHFYRFLTWQQLGNNACFQPLPEAKGKGCEKIKKCLPNNDKLWERINKMRKEQISLFDSSWQKKQGQKTKKVKKTTVQYQQCQALGYKNQKKTLKRY